jgi:hypothetical protein
MKKAILFSFIALFLISFASATDITNCTDLQAMTNMTENYVLINNIDCSDTINWNAGEGFVPIGVNPNDFKGTFDGQGFNITNLYINRTDSGNGLFGSAIGADIRNVNLINVSIQGYSEIGALMGYSEDTNITNVHATGNIYALDGGDLGSGGLAGVVFPPLSTNLYVINCSSSVNVYSSGSEYAGGLFGVFEGIMENSYSTGNVYGSLYTGGLVGYSNGNITNSYATGDVSGSNYVGGLVGQFEQNTYNPFVINSYATGDVNADQLAGGLIGYINFVTIENSYATGDVNGSQTNGGLVGNIEYGIINNSYATGDVKGSQTFNWGGLAGFMADGIIANSYSVGFVKSGAFGSAFIASVSGYCSNNFFDNQTSGQTTDTCATGKTTAEMQTESTFTDVGWDFNNIWQIGANQYPTLQAFGLLPTPPVEEEPQYLSNPSYQVMASGGAGLGIFMQYLAQALPLLLVPLLFIIVITGIGFSIAYLIKHGFKLEIK